MTQGLKFKPEKKRLAEYKLISKEQQPKNHKTAEEGETQELIKKTQDAAALARILLWTLVSMSDSVSQCMRHLNISLTKWWALPNMTEPLAIKSHFHTPIGKENREHVAAPVIALVSTLPQTPE
ncbi:hypothetical protein G9A89_003300 [Geosiphon pyriformis]|nr:hypothetical protein G9A89_003300 [Geosiphon pyriformis]